jgi:hypothetical protein
MNRYLAVIGDQKKYLVYAYSPALAQDQIETLLTGRRAQEAQRQEFSTWADGGKRVEETDIEA